MKRFKLLIVVIAILSSCKGNKSELFQELPIVISGKIKNKTKTCPNVVSIAINDIATGKQITIAKEVERTGEFLLKANLYHSQDINFKYGNTLKKLLIHPGDSISISFDAANPDSTILFEGDRIETNQQLNVFFDKFLNFCKDNRDASTQVATLSPLDYKELVYQQQSQYDSLFNAFKKEIIPNKEVSRWIDNYLKYRCGWDLLQIANIPDIKIPKEYWEFTKQYPINNIEALNCSEYVSYLRYYYLSYFIHKQNKLSEAIRAYRNQNYYLYLTIAKDSIHNNFNGIAKDVLLSQTLSAALNDDYLAVDSVLTNLDHSFESGIFKKLLEKEIKKFKQTSKENLRDVNLVKVEQNDFLTDLLLNRYKNKVVYIDIWATWCGPCLREMSHSKLLHKEFKNSDVVFLYLCSNSNQSTWEKVIKEKELQGEHILLSDDQLSILCSQHNIQGVPWYLVADKSGEIINNAPRPSSPKIKVLFKKLLSN